MLFSFVRRPNITLKSYLYFTYEVKTGCVSNIHFYCFFTPLEDCGKKFFSAITVFFIPSCSEILRTQGFIEINRSKRKFCITSKVLPNSNFQIFPKNIIRVYDMTSLKFQGTALILQAPNCFLPSTY